MPGHISKYLFIEYFWIRANLSEFIVTASGIQSVDSNSLMFENRHMLKNAASLAFLLEMFKNRKISYFLRTIKISFYPDGKDTKFWWVHIEKTHSHLLLPQNMYVSNLRHQVFILGISHMHVFNSYHWTTNTYFMNNFQSLICRVHLSYLINMIIITEGPTEGSLEACMENIMYTSDMREL